ncbi:GNAT family N-acetyltransferase [Lactobacillus sp. DCY120]|uniref:GNAT family N-acetyltransferase n=1 Tax=Bombilactobacillus apium TaxID=2675299 RepID=A0A850RBB8_9LACO|nr:GNAT family N-acetyltransferase [Bombilactobacillus apium]NVY96098.1 GNAT family N-acetyltransferase [Bombilactobacillus apium]
MPVTFGPAQLSDFALIMELENSGFSPAEAASPASMRQRIQKIPDTFIVAYNSVAKPVGYIVGPTSQERYLTDDLFQIVTSNQPQDPFQTVLSLVVAPSYRQQGLGSQLLQQLAQQAQQQGRQLITLTCLQELIAFYQKNGYQVAGQSQSQHAGETWYNLVREL